MAEFRSCVERVKSHPNAWAQLSQNTHRGRTKVFPYGIIYQIRRDEILVVAVMHMSRKPDYWKKRLKAFSILPFSNSDRCKRESRIKEALVEILVDF